MLYADAVLQCLEYNFNSETSILTSTKWHTFKLIKSLPDIIIVTLWVAEAK